MLYTWKWQQPLYFELAVTSPQETKNNYSSAVSDKDAQVLENMRTVLIPLSLLLRHFSFTCGAID